jgi:hypothetical protein
MGLEVHKLPTAKTQLLSVPGGIFRAMREENDNMRLYGTDPFPSWKTLTWGSAVVPTASVGVSPTELSLRKASQKLVGSAVKDGVNWRCEGAAERREAVELSRHGLQMFQEMGTPPPENRKFLRKNQLWSYDFTTKVFCNVEFWLERLPKLIGICEGAVVMIPNCGLTISPGKKTNQTMG